jgi:hypothetical protein
MLQQRSSLLVVQGEQLHVGWWQQQLLFVVQ